MIKTKKKLPLSVVTSAALATITLSGGFLAENTWAAASTLTMKIDSSTVEMNVTANSAAGTFVQSSNSTISASTDNATGYTLKIAATSSDNYTKLINSEDSDASTNSLTSIGEATTLEVFKSASSTGYNGKWGYLPSKYNSSANTSFLPAPTACNTGDEAGACGDTLDVTNTANSTANTYTLAIGARVDSTTKLGSYSNTYNVIMVANAVPYSITYDDNVVSGMPKDITGSSADSTVQISTNTPARDGYVFLGWCSAKPTTSNGADTCSGTTYSAGSNYTLDQTSETNDLTLYAMWKELPAMQNLASASCTTAPSQVRDTRDGTIYTIQRLADNNCWMLDNLALDLVNVSLADLKGKTHASDTTLGYLKDGGGSSPYTSTAVANWTSSYSYTAPLISAGGNGNLGTWDKNTILDAKYGAGSGKVGVYYNYCAASAGSYCYASGSSSGNATEDICPSGWHMPSGNSSGEFGTLASKYSSTTATNTGSLQYNLSTPLSGYFYDGSACYQGSNGYWWSSTRDSNYYMYYLYVNASNVYAANDINRSSGNSMRCVLGS